MVGTVVFLALPAGIRQLLPRSVAETICVGFFLLWTLLPLSLRSVGLGMALLLALRKRGYLALPRAW